MAVLWKTVALALSFTVALGTKYKEGDKVQNDCVKAASSDEKYGYG